MTLSVNNPDSGSASEEIEAITLDAIEIGFNARYLLDIDRPLAGDTALIKLSTPARPTIIQDREGSPALYVLMPLRCKRLPFPRSRRKWRAKARPDEGALLKLRL